MFAGKRKRKHAPPRRDVHSYPQKYPVVFRIPISRRRLESRRTGRQAESRSVPADDGRPEQWGENAKKQAISDGNRLHCLETAVSGRYSSSRFMCAT